ncbi:MAG: NUDIX hydrolase [Planctomycetes bacterium]|nr:NUDIX hydrolase [Planctomycetota bacterium]
MSAVDPRRALLDLLGAYQDAWPDEDAVVARIGNLVVTQEDCLLRTCFTPGHLTASAWVCSQDGARCVLLHHGKLDKWLQPGGHADGEAELERVALREVEEETGLSGLEVLLHDGGLVPLDLDVHVIPARKREPQHEHHDVRFLVIARQDAPLVCSDESRELRWVDVARLTDFTREESVLRLARKAKLLLERSQS